MKKIKYLYAIMAVLAAFVANTVYASTSTTYTAEQVLNKSAAVLQGTKSITFSLTSSGKSYSGTMYVSGKKFNLNTAGVSSWYDGSVLTTYNASTKEATVVKPTADDLRDANPLTAISSWKSQFKAAFSSKTIKDVYVIVLSPTSSGAQVKKAVLTVSKSNFYPKKLVISMKNGGSYTIAINSIKALKSVADSQFTFPKSKYKNAEIIDLR